MTDTWRVKRCIIIIIITYFFCLRLCAGGLKKKIIIIIIIIIMSDFKGKMHKIRFSLGLRPRPRWGSLQHSTGPP